MEQLFSEGRIFTKELNALTRLKTDVTHFFEKIQSDGVESATEDALSQITQR